MDLDMIAVNHGITAQSVGGETVLGLQPQARLEINLLLFVDDEWQLSGFNVNVIIVRLVHDQEHRNPVTTASIRVIEQLECSWPILQLRTQPGFRQWADLNDHNVDHTPLIPLMNSLTIQYMGVCRHLE